MSRELQHKHTMDQFKEVCNGTNCRASKAMPYHSEECRAEHDALHKNRSASPASVPEVTDGMAIAFYNALTDGSIGQSEVDEIKTGLRAALAAAPTPPVSEDRKDAERYLWLVANSFDKSGVTQFHIWKHSWEPHSKTGEQIEFLREQVEKLTKELDNVKQVEFPRRVQKVTDALKRKHEKELAALAEQNEKLRKALTKWRYLDSSYNWRCGSCGNRVEGGHKESCALFLTNLATPVLNETKGNK